MSALSNTGTLNQVPCDPKTQPFCKLRVLMHCLARTCESPTIPVNAIALHVFCGCNCKTSKMCQQKTRFFTIRARYPAQLSIPSLRGSYIAYRLFRLAGNTVILYGRWRLRWVHMKSYLHNIKPFTSNCMRQLCLSVAVKKKQVSCGPIT